MDIQTSNIPVIILKPTHIADRKAAKKITVPAETPRKTVEKGSEAPAKRSDRTPLKKVCAALKIDPKTARRVLRKHKLSFHDLGNRWDLTDSQAKRVKEVLREYAAS